MFGTVVDWREGIARDAAPFLARHGRPDIDPRAFADAWRKRYQPAMEECRTGRRPFTRLDVLHRENLENVLRDNGLDPARIGEAELDAMNRAWHRLDPWPEAVAGLTRLRRQLHAGAALERQRRPAAEHGQARRPSPGTPSSAPRWRSAYKPQPEAYLRTAEILGIRPDELCLVAAHNGDLRAARQCGLATAFVLRRTEHGPDQTTDLAAEDPWDVVAADFQDLAQKLGC